MDLEALCRGLEVGAVGTYILWPGRDPPGQVEGQELRATRFARAGAHLGSATAGVGLRGCQSTPVCSESRRRCQTRVWRIAAARAVGWVALSAPGTSGAHGCPADPPLSVLAAEWSLVFVTSSCDLWSSFQCPLSPRSSHLPRSGIERVLSSPLYRGQPASRRVPRGQAPAGSGLRISSLLVPVLCVS